MRSMTLQWEHAGEREAAALDACYAVALIAAHPEAAAAVALGIGRVQARRRRVAIADAVGDLAPLRALIPDDAVHGLVDYFFHGVSLARVVYPVDPARNLFVLQSGAPPIEHEALLGDRRWPRLARSFREAEALLMIVVPPQSAASERLVPLLDGVVLIGHAEAPQGARVLARVEGDSRSTAPAHSHPAAPEEPAHAADPAGQPPRRKSVRTGIALGVAALALIAVAAWALMARSPGGRSLAAGTVSGEVDERSAQAGAGASTPPADNLAETNTSIAPATPASPFAIVNPGDSLTSVGWTVAFLETRSPSTANARIDQESGRGLSALTYSPVPSDAESGRLFVLTGASRDSADAVALLRALRARGVLRPTQGHLEYLPLALLVQRGAGHDQASFLVNGYRLKGLPVYALLQDDGTLNLYAGAFDDPEAARALMATFHAAGEQPRVVYRTGRTP